MQEFLGSVRRSMVFRPLLEDSQETFNNSPLTGTIMEKINSCVRKSRIFSKPTSPSLPAAPPIRYRKGELIGFGAFGHVYMGMNLDSGELLAIKQVLIAANGASREKAQAHIKELEDEVKLLKNLSHPNIVRYLGTVREEETLNILLEFVPGGSISSLLGKFGPFPEAVIRAYTKQLLLGLEYLHNNGIMHRDIKGANILVDNKGCIKLADFGASKQVVELATVSGAKSMKGTPYWMAPEVILQTGHSFSADIWSVGCTVIEMATGKPPWSQQYQEVAALFYVGSTKSHPEIPEHLSAEAKDFLLKCLQKEPNMRPDASKLLQHQFVTGNHLVADPVICTPVAEISEVPSKLQTTNIKIEASSIFDTEEICNLGSLSCSMDLKKPSQVIDMWRTNNSDDDMCQIGKDDFTLKDVRLSPVLTANDNDKSSEPKDIVLGDWRCKFGDSLEPEVVGLRPDTDQLAQDNSNGSFPRGASVSEDDDELTESKIRAFLDEKALELKKLQTPLYEEFYNSLNAACSPSLVEKSRHETSPNYLKLPPKSRSPSRVPVGTPSTATDAVSTGTPGSNSRHVSNVDNASGQISEDTSSPQHNDHRGSVAEVQPESSSLSPSLSFSEIQRRWKEELDQELEKNREMRRQAGVVGKTSSPKDRSSTRQRERTRFASPGK